MKTLIFLFALSLSMNVFAADAKKKAADAPLMNSTGGSGASTKLDFEDNVVEGMSKSGADLAESMEKSDGADQGHLYKKKADFRPEIRESIMEMGYQP